MNSSKEFAKIAVAAMEEKKAEEIRIIDIAEVSSIGDYFIIANGNNPSQVHAIADFVEEKLGKAGLSPKQIEGYQNANWVLMDYGDIIIHVFDKDNRLFYNLERIWKDGKIMNADDVDFLN
ncbi:MAG: ribosome silencing factor [Lachnospiraceae bacterium]|nr:ribosome silencing factor [Lachnospiraceae bacterium]MBQ8262520.1 ribosome silencing factor [Lachnospiraceae bacterium]